MKLLTTLPLGQSMLRKAHATFLVGWTSALLAACGGGGSNNAVAVAAASALITVGAEAAGTNCTLGGSVVKAGLDGNTNGTLEAAEVASTQYVCSGAAGTNGLTTLVLTTVEPAGGNCANGGSKVSAGLDANANAVLEASEISTTSYVCHGVNGTNGTNGSNGTNGVNGVNSLIAIAPEPAGANCANGGSKVSSGLDSNHNAALDATEVSATAYICLAVAAPVVQSVIISPANIVETQPFTITVNGNNLPYDTQVSTLACPGITHDFTLSKSSQHVFNCYAYQSVSGSYSVNVSGLSVPAYSTNLTVIPAFASVGTLALTECVKNNLTGLTWEGKTNNGGVRDAANLYTYYTDTTQLQKWDGSTYINPSAAEVAASTNVIGYISTVNTSNLCGYSDWRLPTDVEFSGSTAFTYFGSPWSPNIFPSYSSQYYWESNNSGAPHLGLLYDVLLQLSTSTSRSNQMHVRLVRP